MAYWAYGHQASCYRGPMLYLAIKAILSGIVIAAASEIARRSSAFGALITALPLVSILAMIWLWRDRPDAAHMARYAGATFWYVLPSLPMFLLIAALLHRGASFWVALVAGCVLTVILYVAMTWMAPRIGLHL